MDFLDVKSEVQLARTAERGTMQGSVTPGLEFRFSRLLDGLAVTEAAGCPLRSLGHRGAAIVKHRILEWGLIFCFGSALALLTSWVVSRFFDRSSYHLKLSPTGNLRHDLHLFMYEGQFALRNQLDSDSSGRIRPLIVEAKMLIKRDLLRGDRCGQFTIPGLDLRYYWNAPSRGLIWSLEQSLLIPVGLLLLLTAWFRIRLGKLQARTPHISPQAPERQGAEK